MKKIVSIFIGIFLFSIISINSFGQENKNKYGNDKIVIATGISSGTYSMSFQSIKSLWPEVIEEFTESSGGFDNVGLILKRKVDGGLVQADVLDFLQRTNQNVKKQLRSLVGLFPSSLHIIVLKDGNKDGGVYGIGAKTVYINELRDLKGKKVACFASGVITGKIIDERLGLNMDILEAKTKDQALNWLKNGEVFAVFAMGGWPIDWVDDQKKLDPKIFSLANVDTSDISKLGQPYFNIKIEYRSLGIIGANSISVNNDLIVWNYSGKKSLDLLELKQKINDNLDSIKENRDSHPVWNTVENLDDVSWIKYEPISKQIERSKYQQKELEQPETTQREKIKRGNK